MNKIPSQAENPKGLHARYVIKKIVPAEEILPSFPKKYELKDVDEDAEYFVLRLDEGGKDREHIKAGRIGAHAYADAIEHHLPEVAKELKERYPLL